jgi:branched-chain amino acid transport system permease protein
MGLVLSSHHLNLLTKIMILGLFGIAYDFLLGYTGVLSFGHSAFFGLGAYTVVYSVNEITPQLTIVLGLVVILGVILAVLMGAIAFRTSGVYFAMITLAIAQLLYLVVQNGVAFFSPLGGASGLPMFGTDPVTVLPINISDTYQFYVFTVTVLLLSYLILRQMVSSPFGDVLRAIRENEDRAQMVGYNTFYYKMGAFAVSGVFSSIAGALFALYLNFADTTYLHWSTSGDVILQTIFGGVGTLVGPILGAGFIVMVEAIFKPITDQWYLLVGLSFVLVILLIPGGILSLIRDDSHIGEH